MQAIARRYSTVNGSHFSAAAIPLISGGGASDYPFVSVNIADNTPLLAKLKARLKFYQAAGRLAVVKML